MAAVNAERTDPAPASLPELALVVDARAALADGSGKELRERANLSLREAANYIGVVPSVLWRWEAGTACPSPASAARYARFLAQLRSALKVPA